MLNQPQAGERRVFNQFTEIFSLRDLAEIVKRQGNKLGMGGEIQCLENPRVEAEEHYYNPRHQRLIDLGLTPHLLSDVLIDSMLHRIRENTGRIRTEIILPRVRWDHSQPELVKANQVEHSLSTQDLPPRHCGKPLVTRGETAPAACTRYRIACWLYRLRQMGPSHFC